VEGLLSLLFVVVVFYLMMRFGCGVHMTHGSHGHDRETVKKYIDPVCGVQVETEQGYGKMHQDQLYRFCSRDCLDKFEASPEKYINGTALHTN